VLCGQAGGGGGGGPAAAGAPAVERPDKGPTGGGGGEAGCADGCSGSRGGAEITAAVGGEDEADE